MNHLNIAYMKGNYFLIVIAGIFLFNNVDAQTNFQQLSPVNFSQVTINDRFWKPRVDSIGTATLRACIEYTEDKTGRIRNFEKAARKSGEKHEGIYYDDSDVYKALEAIAYALRNNRNPELEKKADEWIAKIAAAQMPDGYLNTYYQLTGLDKRWTDMEKHEDYCAGHLIEAAVAYENTTGKKTLTNVAVKFANHIDSMFRLQNHPWVTGHQEIELALMKLYHHTKDERYFKLAEWLLEQRGHGHGKGKIWEWPDGKEYCQDAVPVKEQKEITGHAVRAMYLYCGAADVAAVNGDKGYMNAMNTIWKDVVYRNMYITGGIGGQAKNEGFGTDYELPNEDAYCETCASVGMTFWNHRMNMLTGEAKFIDVMERSLYNGALDGLSLSGDNFFYGNPLASKGDHKRREWFGTACCPSNIARLVASLGNYIYAVSPGSLWVNLFVGNTATAEVDGKQLNISMNTGYPWNGKSELQINTSTSKNMNLHLRIPGWLTQPVPGDLYSYTNNEKVQPVILMNGKPATYKTDNGYAVISRKWKKGDRVEIDFPMIVRKISSREEVKENHNRVALQYGPLVYCVEGKDNNDKAWNFILAGNDKSEVKYVPGLLGGVNQILFNAKVVDIKSNGGDMGTSVQKITAIPYYAWCNRGSGEMQVWLPTSFTAVRVNE
jgi:uncharacterized protein